MVVSKVEGGGGCGGCREMSDTTLVKRASDDKNFINQEERERQKKRGEREEAHDAIPRYHAHTVNRALQEFGSTSMQPAAHPCRGVVA